MKRRIWGDIRVAGSNILFVICARKMSWEQLQRSNFCKWIWRSLTSNIFTSTVVCLQKFLLDFAGADYLPSLFLSGALDARG